MKKQVDPNTTSRAEAFRMWMSSPMPMVTLTKTLDVCPLCNRARRQGYKFNMLLCWCIGKAASQVEQFYLLPEQGSLFLYDHLAVNVIVPNAHGGINSCDIPLTDSLEEFNRNYLRLTQSVSAESKSVFLEDYMVVGTSAMVQTELDSIVNQYTDTFSNPMVMWGRYRKVRKGLLSCRYQLPVSFQFHHVQMDGAHAAHFLELLQREIRNLPLLPRH